MPKCRMEDVDRFSGCTKLTYTCLACQKQGQEFIGTFNHATRSSGLHCGECGALYMGRRDAADCYSYLSNRVTLLVRQCLKEYYDYWLCCDDTTCGRRTMQQSTMGYACTENCHGRMIQDYNEEKLHTQLKYLESLFDVDRSIKQAAAKKEAQEKDMKEEEKAALKAKELQTTGMHGPADLPGEHKDLFRLLKTHMSNSINWSAYNWISPNLWSFVFGNAPKHGLTASAK